MRRADVVVVVAYRPAAEAGYGMSGVEITVASWDYDRVRPLLDGRVRIEGCRANFLVLNPEECFHRAYLHEEFDVSEIGFSPYLIALSRYSYEQGLAVRPLAVEEMFVPTTLSESKT